MKAIYFDGTGAQLVDGVTLADPGHGQVRVAIKRAGLCHSDVSVLDGKIPFPPPVVLGHEGAGVIDAVGPGVTGLAEGDHVVISTLGNCGACSACETGRPTHCRQSMGRFPRPYSLGDQKMFQFANVGAFAEQTVVSAGQAVRIDSDVPFEVASLIGCGVITGVGAVLNRAKVQIGQTVAVIGSGGIGANVIQGARLAGASRIVAIDANPAKETLARTFGATDFVLAGEGVDVGAAVKDLVPNGVDFAFECVGAAPLIKLATELLDWGGTAVILGVPKLGTEASFMVANLYNDKTIMGCRYGSARPHHDFPMLVDLYKQGRLLLDELVTKTFPMEKFDDAVHALHAGELARGVLEIS